VLTRRRVPTFPKKVSRGGRQIDGERLRQDMQDAVAKLNNEGYEVVTVVPIESGHGEGDSYNHYGYGYSYTEGVIIVTRK